MSFSGRCLCGAVRYQVSGDPAMVFYCHCRDCQRHGGSLLHYGVMVPDAALKLEGELSSYESTSDKGRKITRQFCPKCGSGIRNLLQIAPGMSVLKGGTIEESTLRPRPTFEVFAESRTAWLSEGGRRFERDTKAPAQELLWKAPSED